eukprot:CAMPEP_0118882206 /NCGR_PEP_ID=MMETSP1163-20130328/21493_1 /TAXON_ID=124430 /ORGANISM="Phaeomonas parva, Strain CCMP2877" /LENGTH=366 /DNA_ID=CAMNT_0006819183 /DNA_START=112 /DNA_END=1208 /DNA_ORIENTATION=+
MPPPILGGSDVLVLRAGDGTVLGVEPTSYGCAWVNPSDARPDDGCIRVHRVSDGGDGPLRDGDHIQLYYSGFLGLTAPSLEEHLTWRESLPTNIGKIASVFVLRIGADEGEAAEETGEMLEAGMTFLLEHEAQGTLVAAAKDGGLSLVTPGLGLGLGMRLALQHDSDVQDDAEVEAVVTEVKEEAQAAAQAESAAQAHARLQGQGTAEAPSEAVATSTAASQPPSEAPGEKEPLPNPNPSPNPNPNPDPSPNPHPNPNPNLSLSAPSPTRTDGDVTELRVTFGEGPLGFTMRRAAEGWPLVHKVAEEKQAANLGVEVGDVVAALHLQDPSGGDATTLSLRGQRLNNERWADLVRTFKDSLRPLGVT